MKRIILHWTAGLYNANQKEKDSYHYLIEYVNNEAEITQGTFTPEDNENCYDGKYAKHTGGGNTGSIGIALCGMKNFVSRNDVGNYPITEKQFQKMIDLIVDLISKYNIKITEETIMTHYEFGKKNPKTTSAHKIDIICLPPFPSIQKDEIGNFIRKNIQIKRKIF